MEPRLARLLLAAEVARDQHVAALAQHRRAMAEVEARIAEIRTEPAQTAPSAYTVSGAQQARQAFRHNRLISLNSTLAAMRADETRLKERAALAVAKAEVAARLARKR